VVRGARAVAEQALIFRRFAGVGVPVLVNGGPGLVTTYDGRPASVLGFTVADGRIVAMDILADPDRIARLDLEAVEVSTG
ncbi:MAG: RNA polymerase subunit sigma-70, partial [Streptomycetaceae bacterium]|nr:RNA polymerase subunit sigma-70 [Streptomycetaceae bacterium]